ncbi:MAG: hypothetical protein R2991_14415 [Thermoanaerobaculia bacterium]
MIEIDGRSLDLGVFARVVRGGEEVALAGAARERVQGARDVVERWWLRGRRRTG